MKENCDTDENIFRIEGKKGDVLYWTLKENGEMRIWGNGRMSDYNCGKNAHAPWYEKRQSIRTLIVEEGVTELGIKAFEECQSLSCVVLPDSLKWIRYYCFKGCRSLEEVIIPEDSEYRHLYEKDVENSLSLGTFFKKDMKSGKHPVIIGLHSFLETPWAVKQWGKYYIKEDTLLDVFCESESAKIPEGIHIISKLAFKNIPVKTVILPKSLEIIEEFAFENTSLESIDIPKELKKIEFGAFNGTPLSQVNVERNSKVEIDKDAFINTDIQSPHIRGLYELVLCSAGEEMKEYKKLAIQKRKQNKGMVLSDIGIEIGDHIIRRIKKGSVILAIRYNEEEKSVVSVTSFFWKEKGQEVLVYRMYPIYSKGLVDIWDDSIEHSEEEEIRYWYFCCSPAFFANGEEGIREVKGEEREQWFCSMDRGNFEGPLELDLLEKWLKQNPEYSIMSSDEETE